MEFNWDDISKKITDAANYTVRETGKLTDRAKLKYKLANEKNKLNLLYQNIGKMKYGEAKGELVDFAFYDALIRQVDETQETVKLMEEELAKLRNFRFCIACGAKITNDMPFCPKCGTRQQPEEPQKEPETADAVIASDADENGDKPQE